MFLLAGLGIAVATAFAQSTFPTPPSTPGPSDQQAISPAPQRVIKFFETDFSDPMGWTCVPAQLDGAVLTDPCRACTNTGSNATDITVVHAADASRETFSVPAGSAVEVCRDVLIVESASAGPTAPTSSATPTGNGTPTS